MRKKRIEKKAEKLQKKQIHDVFEMVLKINGLHSRNKELTEDKPTAFFTFYGHTASVYAEVCTNGWGYHDMSEKLYCEAHLDANRNGYKLEDMQKSLERIMEGLKKDGKM
mgnify:CR=1 FL=1